jgi:hypothetical protein
LSVITRFGPAVLALLAAASATAAEVAPHRAIYDLSLEAARSGSPVGAVSGEMLFQWEDDCDGWASEQHYRMEFLYTQGDDANLTSTYTTWESKDGLNLNFTMKSTTNGAVDIDILGSAHLEALGAAGTAEYRRPETARLDLPAGTMLPMAHTLKLIAEAGKGTSFFAARLFDGTEFDTLSEVSAVIGARREPAADARELLGVPSWPVHLAFFTLGTDSAASTPDYEMSLTLYENGVVDQMVIDYGEFSVRARLTDLEPVPPSC